MEIYVTPEEILKQEGIAGKIKARFRSEGKTPKVFIQTYGCQQNEADTENLYALALSSGYEKAGLAHDADLIIVNTCAVREHAELKTLSITGGYKKIKRENPETLIMLCGCMAQEEHIRKKLYQSYPYVDAVFGTDMNHRLPEIIWEALHAQKRLSFVNVLPHHRFGVIAEDNASCRTSSYKALVPVMYGCDNYCAYCVVPLVRGRERSRGAEHIFAETRSLISAGYKDITLLGQNVNSYKGEYSFPGLLEKIASFDGEFWLRFMTSHPKDATKDLIDVMASSEKIAKHFHLPVQSGSDGVLKKMARRYTRSDYLRIVSYIREKLPDTALTTDIICGFPGESEKDFEDTLSLVKDVGFDMIYTFVYSSRPGTAAAKLENQIPYPEKIKRFEALSEMENAIAHKINAGYIGKTVKVLSEGENGRTSQNKIVVLDRPIPEGEFADVKITAARPYGLDGEQIPCSMAERNHRK